MPSREAHELRGALHRAIRVKRLVSEQVSAKRGGGYRYQRPLTKHQVCLSPLAGHNQEFVIFHNSTHNLVKAVNERVFHMWDANTNTLIAPTRPRGQQFLNRRMRKVRNRLVHQLRRTAIFRWSREEVVDHYSGRAKIRALKALESLEKIPLREKDAEINGFGKLEKYEALVKDFEKLVMRIISPRDPRFNLELGRYILAIEHKIFEAIDQIANWSIGCPEDEKSIMKGLNAVERAEHIRKKWARIPNCVAIGMDASRFDAHVSSEFLHWEHSIYPEAFCNSQERKYLRRLLRMQHLNKCKLKSDTHEISYEIHGTRMSGDMNTSLGNTMIMSCMIIAFVEEIGLTNWGFVNDGDDSVLFVMQSELHLITPNIVEAWFDDMGFTMELEDPVYHLEEIEFCQCNPVRGADGYTMVRKWSSLAKDATIIKYTNDMPKMLAVIGATGLCGLAISRGVPVVQEFYKAMIRLGESAPQHLLEQELKKLRDEGWGIGRLSRTMEAKQKEPSEESRSSFAIANGILPHVQRSMEQYYRSVDWSAFKVVDSSIFQRVIWGP